MLMFYMHNIISLITLFSMISSFQYEGGGHVRDSNNHMPMATGHFMDHSNYKSTRGTVGTQAVSMRTYVFLSMKAIYKEKRKLEKLIRGKLVDVSDRYIFFLNLSISIQKFFFHKHQYIRGIVYTFYQKERILHKVTISCTRIQPDGKSNKSDCISRHHGEGSLKVLGPSQYYENFLPVPLSTTLSRSLKQALS